MNVRGLRLKTMRPAVKVMPEGLMGYYRRLSKKMIGKSNIVIYLQRPSPSLRGEVELKSGQYVISIDPDLSVAERIEVFWHELAHIKLGHVGEEVHLEEPREESLKKYHEKIENEAESLRKKWDVAPIHSFRLLLEEDALKWLVDYYDA